MPVLSRGADEVLTMLLTLGHVNVGYVDGANATHWRLHDTDQQLDKWSLKVGGMQV